MATVIDCHTKACIGYAMAEHMRADLVIDALQMAARNYPLAEDAIFHSDRGNTRVNPSRMPPPRSESAGRSAAPDRVSITLWQSPSMRR